MRPILIVEDDKRLGPTLRQGLSEQAYDVVLATDACAALAQLKVSAPALVILDLGLPDRDGIDLLRDIRATGYANPVLVLTARDTVTDKVQGLDAGADDYLAKPFDFTELLARLRALLRRPADASLVLTCGDITIDLLTRRVTKGQCTVDLTPREFDVLAFLAQREGQTVSRDMLAQQVWREPFRATPLDNVIDVHLSRLRRKLATDTEPSPIQVVRGVGIAFRRPA